MYLLTLVAYCLVFKTIWNVEKADTLQNVVGIRLFFDVKDQEYYKWPSSPREAKIQRNKLGKPGRWCAGWIFCKWKEFYTLYMWNSNVERFFENKTMFSLSLPFSIFIVISQDQAWLSSEWVLYINPLFLQKYSVDYILNFILKYHMNKIPR